MTLRVLATLFGDVENTASDRVKYGLFFEALARRVTLVDVLDTHLRGLPLLLDAALTFHPDRRVWRQRFYKNLPAFRMRSRQAGRAVSRYRDRLDVVLQIGVLENTVPSGDIPLVIYSDYTSHLSGQKADAGRSPFTPKERQAWFELERGVFLQADQICTRAAFVRQSLIEDYGVPGDRITVIGGGINFASLPGQRQFSDRVRSSPRVLFIGKDFYRKGGDILLEAFALLRADFPGAELLIVTGDEPRSLPVGARIIPVTWERETIHALYSQADLFVLPSRLETWGDVLLEAMAYGIPCVGVEGEAMGEIIESGKNGLIVPPGDPAALAEAMSFILADPLRHAAWGDAARASVESSFLWEHVVDRLLPALEKAASRVDK